MKPENLLKLIKERRSIRSFQNKEIPDNIINELIEAARWAPSACNLQHWLYVSIKDKNNKKLIQEQGQVQKQILNSPLLLAVFCNAQVSPENQANIQSVSASIMNLSLYAHSIGLGVTWICGFNKPGKIRKILKVPKKYKLIALLMIGYPANNKIIPPVRKEIKEILHKEYYDAAEDFPSTTNIKKWTIEQLNTYQQLISRRGCKFEYLNEDKINEIFEYAKNLISGHEILDYNSFSGLFLSRLQKLPDKLVYGHFLSEPVGNSARIYNKELKKQDFEFGLSINLKPLDAITSFFRLEHTPNPSKSINEFHNALKNQGKLIIVTRNKYSWRGLLDLFHLRQNKIRNRYFLGLQHMGPWRFYSRFEIKKLIKSNNFNIKSIHGKYVFPCSEIINTAMFKNKLSFLKPIFTLIKKIDIFLEKIRVSDYIGETLIIEAIKK